MMIISQDKSLINFDNVVAIFKIPVNKEKILIRANDFDLGEYKTEERANEVLEEIADLYEHSKSCECDRTSLKNIHEGFENFIYEMPKK